jgi:PhnB protein
MAMRPDRYRNATVPHIYIDGAAAGIDFYERAFGAVELFRIARPDGRILHAELSICGSVVMLGDPDGTLYGEPRKVGRCTAGLHLFVDDNAALLRRAIQMGAQEIQPPTDMFYGASSASVRDPFGHVWVLLTWKEDLEPAEMERRGNAVLKVPQAQAQTQGRERTRAQTVITVHSSEAKPHDRSVSPALMEIGLRETFTGDIEAESTVRALQTQRDDRSASMVSMQRVDGKLGGRRGTFVLQGSQIIANGKITATWFVVPRSGTGELVGLRGEGGFEGEFGKGSVGTLSYWFE